jgi:hypothetical protein
MTPKTKKAHSAIATVFRTGTMALVIVPRTILRPFDLEMTRSGRRALRMRRILSTRTEEEAPEALDPGAYSRDTSTIATMTRKKSRRFHGEEMYLPHVDAAILMMHSMRKKMLMERFASLTTVCGAGFRV